MVRDEFVEELLAVLAALRGRVEVEGGGQQQTVDCHVGISHVHYLVEHNLNQLANRHDRLVRRHAVDVLDPELVEQVDEDELGLVVSHQHSELQINQSLQLSFLLGSSPQGSA